jgi:acyl-CoA synthetase (AMP-forming)/AMP-acid ligase II
MLRTELIRPLPELLARHVAGRGSEPAFSDERRTVTWSELEQRTGRLAAQLSALVSPGAVAAICMANRVEAVESYLAVPRAGNVAAFLNPGASVPELAYMLEDSGAKVLITEVEQRERIKEAIDRAPQLREVIVVDESAEPGGGLPYEALLGADPAPDRAHPAPDRAQSLDLDRPAWMLYTSGTTGKPKGVLLTQRSCLWVVAACWAPIVGLSAEDHVLSPLPLFHSYALDLCVLGIVATGAHERLLPRFATDRVIEILRSEAVTFFPGVPAMFHYLVERLGGERLGARALRLCVSAGAILSGGLNEAFERAAEVPLLDGYGITETSTMVTMNWPSGDRPRGSCGLPIPGSSVRLVDPARGADVPTGQDGELIVRGPHLMRGYHNRPKETEEVLQGGWYYTGDLARSDANGYLTITGRIKELIIRGGENVYPAEVEYAIAEHPDVLDAAVVGKPDEALGEVVVAFLVRRRDDLQLDDLRSFLAERLAAYKLPAELHVVEQIPRTGSGKVKRHELQQLLGSPQASDVGA